jgi:hypothetical protein
VRDEAITEAQGDAAERRADRREGFTVVPGPD